jgi:hypothetical protein
VRFDIGEPRTIAAGIDVQPVEITSPPGLFGAMGAFWRQLQWAHPEVAARGRGLQQGGSSSGVGVLDASLLRVADDEVAGYRDAPVLRSWLYLEPDTSPGHTFRLQLVPDLADSVWLDAVVRGPADISTPAGDFPGSLRVGYVIDYGWTDAVNDSGVVLGRYRSRTHGEVFWAPGVGPVLGRETFVARADTLGPLPPADVDSAFAELRLQSWALVPTAVQPASWSAVKRRYR